MVFSYQLQEVCCKLIKEILERIREIEHRFRCFNDLTVITENNISRKKETTSSDISNNHNNSSEDVIY